MKTNTVIFTVDAASVGTLNVSWRAGLARSTRRTKTKKGVNDGNFWPSKFPVLCTFERNICTTWQTKPNRTKTGGTLPSCSGWVCDFAKKE